MGKYKVNTRTGKFDLVGRGAAPSVDSSVYSSDNTIDVTPTTEGYDVKLPTAFVKMAEGFIVDNGHGGNKKRMFSVSFPTSASWTSNVRIAISCLLRRGTTILGTSSIIVSCGYNGSIYCDMKIYCKKGVDLSNYVKAWGEVVPTVGNQGKICVWCNFDQNDESLSYSIGSRNSTTFFDFSRNNEYDNSLVADYTPTNFDGALTINGQRYDGRTDLTINIGSEQYTGSNPISLPLYQTIEQYNTTHPTNTLSVVDVFTATGNDGQDVGSYKRIPSICITNAGTMICATEDRASSSDASTTAIMIARLVNGNFTKKLVMPYKNVSYKKYDGSSWIDYTPATTDILKYRISSSEKLSQITGMVSGDIARIGYGKLMNPSFLIERDNKQGHVGRIYLFALSFAGGFYYDAHNIDGDCAYIYSDDDGVSWSDVNFLNQNIDTTSWQTAGPAPANGFEMSDGTLVIPCMGVRAGLNGSANAYGCGVAYKKVGGDWQFSRPLSGTESTAFEGVDGSIYLNVRTENYSSARSTYKYDMASNTWTKTTNVEFYPHIAIQSNIERVSIDNMNVYLMAILDTSSTSRRNNTIWVSADGLIWGKLMRIYSVVGDGYNAVTLFGDKCGFVFEKKGSIGFVDLSKIILSHIKSSFEYEIYNKIYHIDPTKKQLIDLGDELSDVEREVEAIGANLGGFAIRESIGTPTTIESNTIYFIR